MTNKGRLFLIPTVIAENTQELSISPQVIKVLPGIRYFLAEDIRSARRFLSSLRLYSSIESLQFDLLNKDTAETAIPDLLSPLTAGNDIGIISESGCPGIADPGALAVKYAHEHDIKVVPLTGPSSILLALMAAGLNGQKFAFHGYLPVDNAEAGKVIRELEKESRNKNQTQIFIETPYRNNQLLKYFLKDLSPGTHLCIAQDLTGENEFVKTRTVKDWRMQTIELVKLPTVFLFLV
jgi:16S rRNA (cytidine1402-2'-O)-methyltransferase